MRIRFLRDYRGKLSNEVFYEAGEEVDLPAGQKLVDARRAEPVPAEKPKAARKPKSKTK